MCFPSYSLTFSRQFAFFVMCTVRCGTGVMKIFLAVARNTLSPKLYLNYAHSSRHKQKTRRENIISQGRGPTSRSSIIPVRCPYTSAQILLQWAVQWRSDRAAASQRQIPRFNSDYVLFVRGFSPGETWKHRQ